MGASAASARLIAAVILVAGGLPAVARATTPPPPDIVFFLVDDLHAPGTGATGHPFAITPAVDRLAEGGVVFTRTYVTTPLCSPSRASFLTGRFARVHGVRGNLPTEEADYDATPTFAQALQRAGYRTAFVGKWHQRLSSAPRPGFDRWAAFAGQGVYFGTPEEPISIRFVDGTVDEVHTYTAGEYNTDLLTDYARDFITDVASEPARPPFCLLLWYKAVHGPRQPASRHVGAYAGAAYAPLPASVTQPSTDGKPEALHPTITDWNQKSTAARQTIVDQFARKDQEVLAAVDESIAAVLRLLDDLALSSSTVVVFSSDNGYFFREFGLHDKRWLYEPSTRVPLIIHTPGTSGRGRRSDQPVLNIDLAPTLLELAGLEPPAGLQGRSLVPLLGDDGPAPTWRTSWFNEYFVDYLPIPEADATTAILDGRTWKYLAHPWARHEDQLYDLTGDPDELHNLLGDARLDPDLVATLRHERARLAAQASGAHPPAPFFDCYARDTGSGEPEDEALWIHLDPTSERLSTPVRVAGRRARSTSYGTAHLDFDLVDDWTADGRDRIELKVVYLDRGTGPLGVTFPVLEGSVPARRTRTVDLTDSGLWRSRTFDLGGVSFNLPGTGISDIRLEAELADSLVIDRLELLASPPSHGELDFGADERSAFLYRVEAPGARTTPATVDGRACRRGRSLGSDRHLLLDLAPELVAAAEGGTLILTLEVADRFRGQLTLEAAARDGGTRILGRSALGGSLRWRQLQFNLPADLLGDGLANGADLDLSTTGTILAVARVTVDVGSSAPRRPTGRSEP